MGIMSEKKKKKKKEDKKGGLTKKKKVVVSFSQEGYKGQERKGNHTTWAIYETWVDPTPT